MTGPCLTHHAGGAGPGSTDAAQGTRSVTFYPARRALSRARGVPGRGGICHGLAWWPVVAVALCGKGGRQDAGLRMPRREGIRRDSINRARRSPQLRPNHVAHHRRCMRGMAEGWALTGDLTMRWRELCAKASPGPLRLMGEHDPRPAGLWPPTSGLNLCHHWSV